MEIGLIRWQPRFHRNSIVLFMAIVLAGISISADELKGVMPGGVAAPIENEELALAQAVVWSGKTETASETFHLTAISGTVNGETVVFGCLRDLEGIAMAFIDATDDRPLVTVFWYPFEGFSSGMVSLWSNGLCQFIEVRRRHSEDFGNLVPWLSTAVPMSPPGFLQVSDTVQNAFLQQASIEFLRFNNSDQTESMEAVRWIVRDEETIPEFLDERRGVIESRFFEMRDLMEKVTASGLVN